MNVTWRNHYGQSVAVLGRGALTLVVEWDAAATRYHVRVANRPTSARFLDAESAKAAALQLARDIIAEMRADLNDTLTEGSPK